MLYEDVLRLLLTKRRRNDLKKRLNDKCGTAHMTTLCHRRFSKQRTEALRILMPKWILLGVSIYTDMKISRATASNRYSVMC